MALNARQSLFVAEYLKDLNATQAAIRAGYSQKTAEVQAHHLLRNPKIAAAVKQAMEKRGTRCQISQDRVLEEYARLAFFDVRRLFDADGKPIPITQLDDDTARVIVGLDVATIWNKDAGLSEVLKYKLADKKGALDSVARHLGMFIDKTQLSGDPNNPVVIDQITRTIVKPK